MVVFSVVVFPLFISSIYGSIRESAGSFLMTGVGRERKRQVDRYLTIWAFFSRAERVAVKIIEKTGMDQKALKMLSREITNMDTVRHPAIVR